MTEFTVRSEDGNITLVHEDGVYPLNRDLALQLYRLFVSSVSNRDVEHIKSTTKLTAIFKTECVDDDSGSDSEPVSSVRAEPPNAVKSTTKVTTKAGKDVATKGKAAVADDDDDDEAPAPTKPKRKSRAKNAD